MFHSNQTNGQHISVTTCVFTLPHKIKTYHHLHTTHTHTTIYVVFSIFLHNVKIYRSVYTTSLPPNLSFPHSHTQFFLLHTIFVFLHHFLFSPIPPPIFLTLIEDWLFCPPYTTHTFFYPLSLSLPIHKGMKRKMNTSTTNTTILLCFIFVIHDFPD
eukprot:UN01990